MIITRDIYYKIGRKLEERDFVIREAKEQQEILDDELKNYICEKLVCENIKNDRKNNINLLEEKSVYQLLETLKGQISPEEQMDVFSNLTLFVLKVASDLQSYSICWWIEKDENLIDSPIAKFNEEGFWDSIVTHEKTDHLRSFGLAYDIINNRFIENRKGVKRFVKK